MKSWDPADLGRVGTLRSGCSRVLPPVVRTRCGGARGRCWAGGGSATGGRRESGLVGRLRSLECPVSFSATCALSPGEQAVNNAFLVPLGGVMSGSPSAFVRLKAEISSVSKFKYRRAQDVPSQYNGKAAIEELGPPVFIRSPCFK